MAVLGALRLGELRYGKEQRGLTTVFTVCNAGGIE